MLNTGIFIDIFIVQYCRVAQMCNNGQLKPGIKPFIIIEYRVSGIEYLIETRAGQLAAPLGLIARTSARKKL